MSEPQFVIERMLPGMAEAMCEAVLDSVDEMLPWMTWAHADYTLAESLAWLEVCQSDWRDGTAYNFAIVDQRSGTFVGGCGLNRVDLDWRMANLGYWVRSGWRSQGAASQASRQVARFGFAELGLKRIEIVVAAGNLASQRAALKAGAQREGVLRNRLVVNEEQVGAVMFSLVPEDVGL